MKCNSYIAGEIWRNMVYVIVAIALFCLTVKGYCGKRTGGYIESTGDSYLFNLLRMIFCIVIGGIFVFAEGAQHSLAIEQKMIWICVLAGVSNAVFLVGWLLAIQKNTMVSVDVSLTLGSIIPAVLCAILFGEEISLIKMFGFAMILAASIILAGHSKKKAGGGLLRLLLLLIAAVGDGMSGFAQQLYKQYYTEAGTLTNGINYPKVVYHFYTYVFAAIALLAVFVCYRAVKNKKCDTPEIGKSAWAIPRRAVLHIFIMAVCLFAANYLQTVAANDYGMSSQVLYPIMKGGCLITVNFTAMIFFGEKITTRGIWGTLLALGGIISMSIL